MSELARIGPAEVRERYGVEPAQVPDFIALRGDPSDKIPGARRRRAEDGRDLLKQYGASTRRSPPGRFSAVADDLRLYRRIAHDGRRRAASCARADQTPTWARGAERGPRARAERARDAPRRARPDGGRQPPGVRDAPPDREPPRVAGADRRPPRAARVRRVRARRREEDVLRCHTPALVELVRTARGWLDGDTICTETSFEAALLAAGAAIEAVRARRFRARPAAGPPRRPGARDGLLPLQPGRGRGAVGAGRARASGASRSSTGTSTTATAPRTIFRDDPSVLYVSLHQWPFYPGTGGPGRPGRDASSTSRSRPGPATRGYLDAFDRAEDAIRRFEPELAARLRRLRRARRRSARRARALDGRASPSSRAARAALAPRVAAVLEGGYNLATLPDLVEAALAGFRSPA